MKSPSLAELRAFVLVATERSFRRSAGVLGVSHSALSLSLRHLEAAVGTRLLNRTTRSVSLTPEGERLLARLQPVLGELDAALEDTAAASGSPSGNVRINGSEGAIRWLLRHVVPTFQSRFPRVALDLVVDGALVDIVDRGFDAGIRLGESLPRDMVAVALSGDMRFLAVAAPAYLSGRPAPQTPADLQAHVCIRQRLPSGRRYHWEFARDGQAVAVDVPGMLTLDSSQLMVEAACDGLGIAYVPDVYAAPFIASGELVCVLEAWCPAIPGLFLYFPANRHMPPGLRALVDVIKARREVCLDG